MKKNVKKGFTLVELIVVIAILGILAAVIVPRFTGFQTKARGTQALIEAKQVATAIDAYEVENGKYPSTAELTKIATAAGVASANIVIDGAASGDADADGGFTVKVEGADGKFYRAGRGTGADPVKMISEGLSS